MICPVSGPTHFHVMVSPVAIAALPALGLRVLSLPTSIVWLAATAVVPIAAQATRDTSPRRW